MTAPPASVGKAGRSHSHRLARRPVPQAIFILLFLLPVLGELAVLVLVVVVTSRPAAPASRTTPGAAVGHASRLRASAASRKVHARSRSPRAIGQLAAL